MSSIFDSLALSDLSLPNRMVMAPLTRNRAGAGNVPTPLMATFYGGGAKGYTDYPTRTPFHMEGKPAA